MGGAKSEGRHAGGGVARQTNSEPTCDEQPSAALRKARLFAERMKEVLGQRDRNMVKP
jgi:hypothetical protein